MPKGWRKIGAGAYNTAYVSDDGKSVLKIQKNPTETDDPERSVRLWNEINPNLPPPAAVVRTELGVGWVCPFVKGAQASDQDMKNGLIDIYNRTGRIIVDAMAKENFVRTPANQVLCIDVGMAIQMERREEAFFAGARRKSIVSLNAWATLEDKYAPFFQSYSSKYPETVNTVKALVFIKNNRPDIFDTTFLKNDSKLIRELARAYDKQDAHNALSHLNRAILKPVIVQDNFIHAEVKPKTPEEVNVAKDLLKAQRPINFDNLKESCMVELKRYIASRGSLNESTDVFDPSFRTKHFRNTFLTVRKVNEALDLMIDINKADSLDELYSAISAKYKDPINISSNFRSGLERALGKCMVIVEVGKTNANEKKFSQVMK
ncbi:MAG: hypothetical protein PSV35_10775 [bacterium]|nr:hypothetical protein [bacterium]